MKICLICNKECKSIGAHINKYHNLSLLNYIIKYLDFKDKICKCGCKKVIKVTSSHYYYGFVPDFYRGHFARTEKFKTEIHHKGNKQSVESNIKRSLSHKGRKNSKQHIENSKKGLKKFYENGGTNWNKGLTKETDERLKKLGEKISKSLIYLFNETEKGLELRQKNSKRMSEYIKQEKFNRKLYNTKPELAFKDTMNFLNKNYEFQKYIPEIGIVDFYERETNTIIFIDGCYWHSCPKCYTYETRRGKRGFDSMINKKCIEKGYKILRIWEHDIYELKDLIIKELDWFRSSS